MYDDGQDASNGRPGVIAAIPRHHTAMRILLVVLCATACTGSWPVKTAAADVSDPGAVKWHPGRY